MCGLLQHWVTKVIHGMKKNYHLSSFIYKKRRFIRKKMSDDAALLHFSYVTHTAHAQTECATTPTCPSLDASYLQPGGLFFFQQRDCVGLAIDFAARKNTDN
jgi:hypothetical protein